ncbi:MAG TPA: methyltransferase domain-containing protein [Anaerolineae bacterium]|nr:methyltransferase domain-containing protein [Anaerolineae bacterium]
MSKIADQHYLRSDQYRDSANLDARIVLHRRFSTNTYGWYRWCFDRFDLPPRADILELGCGPAYLWHEMIDRVQAEWTVSLSDLSIGMIGLAQKNLNGLNRHALPVRSAPEINMRHAMGQVPFRFEVIDAQSIPFADAQFDAVIADHMLYHVPDRSRALKEIRRVLKPTGRFFCATNGHAHLRELHALMRRFDPDTDFGWGKTSAEQFSLEDGAELAPYFADITVRRYPDTLIVTEVEPLVSYVFSMTTTKGLIDRYRADLTRFIQTEMQAAGSIRITKDSGMFICMPASRAGSP